MTVLPWVRLDSGMPENPKINQLISRPRGVNAAFVYLCSLSYSGKHGTYGSIPKAALPFIHGTLKDAAMLTSVGLWTPNEYGWNIHDWDAYQPDEAYMQRRKDKARKAAETRWGKKREQEAPPLESAGPPPF